MNWSKHECIERLTSSQPLFPREAAAIIACLETLQEAPVLVSERLPEVGDECLAYQKYVWEHARRCEGQFVMEHFPNVVLEDVTHWLPMPLPPLPTPPKEKTLEEKIGEVIDYECGKFKFTESIREVLKAKIAALLKEAADE